MNEMLNAIPHFVLPLDGRQISLDLLIRSASRIGDEILQVVRALELDLAVEFTHGSR